MWAEVGSVTARGGFHGRDGNEASDEGPFVFCLRVMPREMAVRQINGEIEGWVGSV